MTTPASPPPANRASWRRPAVLAAVALAVIVAAAAVRLVMFAGASPIVLVLALVLAIAPWASIIDEREGPRRKG